MNALRSWRKAFPNARILLFGNGAGYEEAARQVDAELVPDIACNEHGLPRVDAMFASGQKRSSGGPVAYLNCDIILFDDVAAAAHAIRFPRFLMVARRWNLDVSDALDLASDMWQDKLRDEVRARGLLFRLDAIDFFLWQGDVWQDSPSPGSSVFDTGRDDGAAVSHSRGTEAEGYGGVPRRSTALRGEEFHLPPMVVGRGGYDNWLIYSCRARGIPVVDATERCTIVHQNHDYGHIEGGRDVVMDGPEARRNVALGGGRVHTFTIGDADWRLTKDGLETNRCREDARRCAEVFAILHPESTLARSRQGRFLLEAGYEWLVRADGLRKGRLLPFMKFLPWLVRRAAGRYSTPSKSTRDYTDDQG